MKLITVLVLFFSFSSFGFFAPQQSGVPNMLLCMAALQAGMNGTRVSDDEDGEMCYTVEECYSLLEEAEEDLEETIEEFEDNLNSSIEDKIEYDGFQCNKNSSGTEVRVVSFKRYFKDMFEYTTGSYSSREEAKLKAARDLECDTFTASTTAPMADPIKTPLALNFNGVCSDKCAYKRFLDDYEVDDDFCFANEFEYTGTEYEQKEYGFFEFAVLGCEALINEINENGKEIRELKEQRQAIQERIAELEELDARCSQDPDLEECESGLTEGGTFCTECFNSVIKAGQPKRSIGDRILDNIVPAAALFLGYKGIKETNNQAALAGYEPNNSAYASLAFPFIAQALYGGNRGLSACSGNTTNSAYNSFGAASLFGLLGGGFPGGGGIFQGGGGIFPGQGPGIFPGGVIPWGGGGGVTLPGFPFNNGGFNFNTGFPFNNNGNFNFNTGFPFNNNGNFNFNTGFPFNNNGIFNSNLGIDYSTQISAQLEAQAKYQQAYMERIQLIQQRQMAQASSLSSLNEELVRILNQRQRIVSGNVGL